MNKTRRKQLGHCLQLLREIFRAIQHDPMDAQTNKTVRANIKAIVSTLQDISEEEQNALDAMPENLRNSARCEAMQEAIDALDEAIPIAEELEARLNDGIFDEEDITALSQTLDDITET